MIRNREVIVILLLVMSISALPFATAESHYGPDCDAAYCFRTQTTLFDSNNNSTNYMYDIPTEWEDNYTAEEQIINAFDYWGMNYTTNQTDGNTSITEINGEQSNLTWHWAIYTKQNGVWTLNNLTINQIIVNKIPNYAVCLSDNNTNCGVESIDEDDEENYYRKYIHRLSNQTLIDKKLNNQMKNRPFNEKKTDYRESQIPMSSELAEFDDWGPEQIEERGRKLAEQALGIWPLISMIEEALTTK